MKKHLTIIFNLVVLIGAFNGIDFGQNKKLSQKDIELRIAPPRMKSRVENVELNVTLENHFYNAVSLSADRQDPFAGYEVTIIDSNGRKVDKTKNPYPSIGIGSWIDWEINSNYKEKKRLELSLFYDFKPGRYTVTVSGKIFNTKKRESVLVTSNTIKLILVS